MYTSIYCRLHYAYSHSTTLICVNYDDDGHDYDNYDELIE